MMQTEEEPAATRRAGLRRSVSHDAPDEHQRAFPPSATGTDEQHDSEPPKPAQPPQAPRKVLFLDGVRGIATTLVVVQHASYLHGLGVGHTAVDIFFVLSSFLLTWLFYKKAERLLAQRASRQKWGYALADYFSKRFFRVYPLFALVAVFLWLLPYESQKRYFLVPKDGDYDLVKVLTFNFEHRFHVFWTLPLEIGYYFLIPVFVLGTLWCGRGWWVPFVPLAVWIFHDGWTSFRGDHQTLAMHLPTFVCGSMAAVVFVKIDAAIKRNNFEFRTWHVYAVRAVEFVTFWLLLSVVCRGLLFDWLIEHPHQVEGGARFISFHVTLLILIEMILPSVLSEALEWSVLRHWGKIGFSVYLLHSFVIYNEFVLGQANYYNRMVLCFFFTHIVSTASFHLLEMPCQMMAARISKRLAAMEANVPTPVLYSVVEMKVVPTHGGSSAD